MNVLVHCLTTGSPAPNRSDVRREECLAAGAVLGVENYTFSEIPDTRFTDHRGDINAELLRVFGCGQPDIVYTRHCCMACTRLGLPFPAQSNLASTARDIFLRE